MTNMFTSDRAPFLGTDADGHTVDTVGGRLETLLEHVHGQDACYPTLANGVVVTTDAGAWTLGAFVEIVPASTITSDFDIHQINIEAISAADVFELVLYYGASDTECARCRFVKTAAQSNEFQQQIVCPIIPANSKIRAKIASAAGGAKTATVSLQYHTY